HVPDILCNGRFDPERGDVPAFEELVGSHGGLGGTQAQPFLLSPVDLTLPAEPIVGAESLHRAIKPWAEAAMRDSNGAAAPGPQRARRRARRGGGRTPEAQGGGRGRRGGFRRARPPPARSR